MPTDKAAQATGKANGTIINQAMQTQRGSAATCSTTALLPPPPVPVPAAHPPLTPTTSPDAAAVAAPPLPPRPTHTHRLPHPSYSSQSHRPAASASSSASAAPVRAQLIQPTQLLHDMQHAPHPLLAAHSHRAYASWQRLAADVDASPSPTDTRPTVPSQTSCLTNLRHGEHVWEWICPSFGWDIDNDDDAADWHAAELVTGMAFNSSGEYLAISRHDGTVEVLHEDPTARDPNRIPYYLYFNFHAHDTSYDTMYGGGGGSASVNALAWWPWQYARRQILMTATDRTVKLWSVGERKRTSRRSLAEFVRGVGETQTSFSARLSPAKRAAANIAAHYGHEDADKQIAAEHLGATTVATFHNPYAHAFHSVGSMACGDVLMCATDAHIHLWHPSGARFTVVQLPQPDDRMALPIHYINVARTHPTDPHAIVYGDETGRLMRVDTRIRSQPQQSVMLPALNADSLTQYGLHHDILDARFTPDGHYILTRDVLHLRLWDPRMPERPIYQMQVHPSLTEYAQQFHQLGEDVRFHQFTCAMDPNGTHYLTGSYSNTFTVHNFASRRSATVYACDHTDPIVVNEFYQRPDGGAQKQRLEEGGNALRRPYHRPPLSLPTPNKRLEQLVVLSEFKVDVAAAAKAAASAFSLPSPPAYPPPFPLTQCFDYLTPRHQPNFEQPVLHCAWHPSRRTIAVAGLYKAYIYQARIQGMYEVDIEESKRLKDQYPDMKQHKPQ